MTQVYFCCPADRIVSRPTALSDCMIDLLSGEWVGGDRGEVKGMEGREGQGKKGIRDWEGRGGKGSEGLEREGR